MLDDNTKGQPGPINGLVVSQKFELGGKQYTWFQVCTTAFTYDGLFHCLWVGLVLGENEKDAIERAQIYYAPGENDAYAYTTHQAIQIRYLLAPSMFPDPQHVETLLTTWPFFQPLFEMNEHHQVTIIARRTEGTGV